MSKNKIPKLGLKPPVQKNLMKAIPFSHLFTGTIPAHPVVEDHYSAVKGAFQLYQNDKYGDCGPTGVGNQRILVSTYLGAKQVIPTQADIFDLYRRATKPPFNPKTGANDNGVVLQDLCGALVKGGIAGTKAVAFARVNLYNLEEAAAAVSIFGSLLLGVNLEVAQQSQTPSGTWDYVWNSGEWGGHCVLGCGYDKTNIAKATGNVVTWAQVVKMTLPFMKHQMSEAWVVIWPENLGTKQFQQGIKLDVLKSDFQQITGSKLILP